MSEERTQEVQDVGAEVVNVAEDHAFHVVTDPGRRFLTKQWVDADTDCEHLVVRETPTADAASEDRTPTRIVYLDPRITNEAALAILRNAGEHDRFMLRIDPADRGLVHQWTDASGTEFQQTLDVEVFEVTPMVWERVRRIREAVANVQ